MSYVTRAVRQPKRTMTDPEQALILRVTGEHRDGFRDHVLISTALGTGLREFELAALSVGDVSTNGVNVRTVFVLRVFKRCTDDPAPQEVFPPDSLRYKLRTFLAWKKANGESLALEAPLFVSREGEGRALSTRTIRHLWKKWQRVAGFDRAFSFHEIRHTALTNVVKKSGDVRFAQRQGRHKDINTTMIYTAPSDDEIRLAVADLPC